MIFLRWAEVLQEPDSSHAHIVAQRRWIRELSQLQEARQGVSVRCRVMYLHAYDHRPHRDFCASRLGALRNRNDKKIRIVRYISMEPRTYIKRADSRLGKLNGLLQVVHSEKSRCGKGEARKETST